MILTSAAIALASTPVPLDRAVTLVPAPLAPAMSAADDQAQAPVTDGGAQVVPATATATETETRSDASTVAESQVAEPSAEPTSGSAPPLPPPYIAPDLSSPPALDVPSTYAPPVDPNADAPEVESAEIVITGRKRDPGDPLARINAQSFAVTQAIDEAVIEPAARGL